MQELTDGLTGDLILVGAKRTVRVSRMALLLLGRDRAIQEAVTRAWRTERMLRQVRDERIREQVGPYPV